MRWGSAWIVVVASPLAGWHTTAHRWNVKVLCLSTAAYSTCNVLSTPHAQFWRYFEWHALWIWKWEKHQIAHTKGMRNIHRNNCPNIQPPPYKDTLGPLGNGWGLVRLGPLLTSKMYYKLRSPCQNRCFPEPVRIFNSICIKFIKILLLPVWTIFHYLGLEM